MGKIKTEDCVKALEEKFGAVCSWKRIGKFKDGAGIARLFQERNTGAYANVYDENGEIKDVSLGDYKPKKDVAVVKKENPIYYVIHKYDGEIGLTVTDANEFNTHNRASDWTPDGTFEELDRLGYPGCEDAEGVVEFCNPIKNIKALKDKLESSPVFKFSRAFYEFMLEYSNEEYEVLPV